MPSSKTDAALLMVQAKEAQWLMKADGYLRLELRAGVTDRGTLCRKRLVCLRGVANGKMGSMVVQGKSNEQWEWVLPPLKLQQE